MIGDVLSGMVKYRKIDGRLDLVDAADGSSALHDVFHGKSRPEKFTIQQALELRVIPARPDVRIGSGARGQVPPDAGEFQLSDGLGGFGAGYDAEVSRDAVLIESVDQAFQWVSFFQTQRTDGGQIAIENGLEL